jgi:hypothetical protein
MKHNDFSTAQWGNNVSALMDVHGIGVREMADELGISVQAAYGLKKNGFKVLTAQRAAQLQTLLKTDFHKIFPLITSGDDQ